MDLSKAATARLEAMLQWRQHAQESGRPMPSDADLERVAEAGRVSMDVDPASCWPWRRTLEHVIARADRGARDPGRFLPEELKQPMPPQPTQPSANADRPERRSQSPQDTELFNALRAWRDSGLAKGRGRFAGVKDSTLRQIVKGRAWDVGSIARALPGDRADLAEEFAGLLADLTGSSSPADDVGAPARAADAGRGDAPPGPSKAATAVPTAAQGPATTAPEAAPPQPEPLDPERFAPYDFSPPADAPAPSALHVTSHGAGLEVQWEPLVTTQPTVVYRLVASDDYRPYAPERAVALAVTTDCRATDDAPRTSAVRFLQVWANAGQDVADATRRQPVLHAEQVVVHPVRDFVLREDEGHVVGQWSVWPGTERVHIFRIPAERAATARADAQFRIQPDQAHLSGFVDRDVERGRRYVYQVAAEVPVEGASRLSAPRSADVLVPAVLAPVTDLEYEAHDDGLAFDLTWTAPPGGRVVVYRTQTPPRAGAAATPLAEDALEQASLPPDTRLPHPVTALDDGRAALRSVPWPEGWTRACFTPVTLLDGMARIGTSRTTARSSPVRDARLTERVQQQLLTFAWPPGTDAVQVYVGVRGHEGAAATGPVSFEVSKSQYEHHGGLTFSRPLPRRGCSLHLVPVTYEGGAVVAGSTTVVDYPGLVELRYDVEVKRNILGRGTTVAVAVSSPEDLTEPPPFVLVHNGDRLPLDVRDGRALEVGDADDPEGRRVTRFTPGPVGPLRGSSRWIARVDGLTGYVRLFVDIDPEHLMTVALLDPDIGRLRLDPRRRRPS